MPVSLLPVPRSSRSENSDTQLVPIRPPVEALWKLPCVSAVARGVQLSHVPQREADITSVLGPSLSAAAAQSIFEASQPDPPDKSVPLTSAAAAAVPHTLPSVAEVPPPATAEPPLGTMQPALHWLATKHGHVPSEETVAPAVRTTIACMIPLIGRPAGPYDVSDIHLEASPPAVAPPDATAVEEAADTLDESAAAPAVLVATSPAKQAELATPDSTAAATPPPASEAPPPPPPPLPLPPTAPSAFATFAGGVSRGYSRSASWYPSPSATPPRQTSPTPPVAEGGAPPLLQPNAPPATTTATATAAAASIEALRVSLRGGASASVAAGEQTAPRTAAAAVVRAACELHLLERRNASPPPIHTGGFGHVSEHLAPPGTSDAPGSVSWQSATYGPYHDTVLPMPSQPPTKLMPSRVPSRPPSAASLLPTATGDAEADHAEADHAEADHADAGAVAAADADADASATGASTASAMPPPPPMTSALVTSRHYLVHSSALLKPRPRYLEMSTTLAKGAVGEGGKPRPRTHPTAYRSVERLCDVLQRAPDGQCRHLPPDRPTLLSHHRLRFKVVAGYNSRAFRHSDPWPSR